MRIISLFDGISCARVAADRAGLEYDGDYFAAEIDPYAIKIAKKNYPDTGHIGDVRTVSGYMAGETLVLGGSPCQGFSKAGKLLGHDDPRSTLFWEFARIVEENQKEGENYFLLENVQMRKEDEAIITDALGVDPVMIDSALVSGQSRKRLYWANFPITQPEDKHIYLHHILEDGVVDREKSYCIDASYYKSGKGSLKNYFDKSRRQLVFGCEDKPTELGHALDIKGHDILKRVYSPLGKAPTLTTITGGNQHKKVATSLTHYRKLTPLECERLQTLPDGYTEGVSNSQRYKMLGNAWTVDVIAHILGDLKNAIQ